MCLECRIVCNPFARLLSCAFSDVSRAMIVGRHSLGSEWKLLTGRERVRIPAKGAQGLA